MKVNQILFWNNGKILKEGSNWICISIMLIDSVLKK